MATFVRITAFAPSAFARHAFQIADDALGDAADYSGHDTLKRKRREKRRRTELSLDQALAKAFEPKRRVEISTEPWLYEPVPLPEAIVAPEFNPRLAALNGDIAKLQAEIAQRKAIALNEEADIELLLMSM